MSVSWKKIVLVTLGAIAVIVAGYFLWISLTSPVVPGGSSDSLGGTIPEGEVGGALTQKDGVTTPTLETPNEPIIEKVSHAPVLAFWVFNNQVYYIARDGSVSLSGKDEDTQISSQKMAGIRQIQLSPWGDGKVLVAFGPIGGASWGIFDTNDRAWRPLPNDLIDVTWGTKQQEVVATSKAAGGVISLVSVDLGKPSAAYKTVLKNFAFTGVSLRVKIPQTLIISEIPSGFSTSRAWTLDLKKLSLAEIAAPEAGFTLEVADDHKTLFQFSPSERVVYVTSDSLRASVETLPGKCASGATSTEAYCFAPQGNVPESSILPDDYYQEKFFTNDRLFHVGTSSVDSVSIPLASQIDAKSPLYSSQSIYFINRPDGFVYKISPVPGK